MKIWVLNWHWVIFDMVVFVKIKSQSWKLILIWKILSENNPWWYSGYSFPLTHWGGVTHICISKLIIIGSDNGLSPHRRQAIIWTNAGILLIGPLGTNFSENLIGIQTLSFKKMHLKISSAKWRPFCLGLNLLSQVLLTLQNSSSRLIKKHMMQSLSGSI